MSIALVENQVANFKIAIPDNASIVEKTVSSELADYIFKATGAKAEIISESSALGTTIYVGHTEFAKTKNIIGTSKENWIIKTVENNIVLTGGIDANDRGVAYSVYHFLEDYLGVHWWNYSEEYVPDLKDFSVEENIDDNQTPLVPYRKVIELFTHENFLCQARNRMNIIGDDGITDGAFDSDVKARGGAIYMGPPHHVHTLPKYFPVEEYFEKHPEWWAYSEVLDKRIDYGQLCLTNESLYKAMLDKLIANIENENKKCEATGTEKPYFYSISFADRQYTCECPKCSEQIKNAGISGYALKFVNRLAKDVAKLYPDVLLETLAYMRYIEPPLDDTVPEKNVIIRYADIPQSSLHDLNHPINADPLRRTKEWAKLCRKNGSPFFIWDYHIHHYPPCPMPQAHRIIENAKINYEFGASGYLEENESYNASDFYALAQWLSYKVLEDPTQDGEKLIDTFMNCYYGKAGKYLKEYLQICHEVAEKSGFSMRLDEPATLWNYVTLDLIEKGMPLLLKAKEAVAGNSQLEARVKIAKLGMLNAIAGRYYEFKKQKEAAGEKFEYDLKAVCDESIDAFKEFEKIFAYNSKGEEHKFVAPRVRRDISIMQELAQRKDESFKLPRELADIDAENVVDIYAKNIVRFYSADTGVTIIEDSDSEVDKVMKFSRKAMSSGYLDRYTVTSADALLPKPLSFFVKKKNNEVKVYAKKIDLYREDIVQNGYHLYKLEGIKGITPESNLVLYIINQRDIAVDVSQICKLMPFKECDIYVSMKATGEYYGGNKEDDDALYFDRFIIVKTK